MKKNILSFLFLSTLAAILFFTRNIPRKGVNVRSTWEISQASRSHKHKEPYLRGFDIADRERTEGQALDSFVKSILLQQSSHNIFDSAITDTAANIQSIHETGLTDAPIANKTPAILIMIMAVFTIFLFTIKVF